MITRKTLMGLLCAAVLLFAADDLKQKAVVTNTQHLEFPSGGLLRMVHSTGTVSIEAWDQPGVEMTTVKSTKVEYDAQDRERAAREFQKIQIKTDRKGDELVISTEFSHLRLPPPLPWGEGVRFDLEYRIRAPRGARIAVEHNIGEVDIENISGDIQAKVKQGLILLHLPEDRPLAIDAKSDTGAVNSDFPGSAHSAGLFFTGHQFVGNASGAAQKLSLRIRYGDIVILKEHSPAPAK